MDYPGEWVQPLMISTLGKYASFGLTYPIVQSVAAPTSSNILGGSTGSVLTSFTLPGPYTVRAFYVYNGATVTGNIDMGIYQINPGQTSLTRVVSTGATAQTGASTVQTLTCTATRLDRGTYYMALGITISTQTFFSVATTYGMAGGIGCHISTSGSPLPATLTAATWSLATVRVPWMGISRNTTI